VFAPDVAHLRAWLAIFDPYEPEDDHVTSPAAAQDNSQSCPIAEEDAALLKRRIKKVVFVYNFLGVHRDTKNWNAQGLGNSASALIECTNRHGMQSIIIEPKRYEDEGFVGLDDMIDEGVPILSLKEMKALAWKLEEEDDGSWITQTVPIRQMLGRWFQFGPGPWDEDEGGEEADSDEHPPLQGEYPYSLPSFDEAPWEHEYEEDQQGPWDEDDEEQMDARDHEMHSAQVSSTDGLEWDHEYEEDKQDTQY
jgi:hypothetical protein